MGLAPSVTNSSTSSSCSSNHAGYDMMEDGYGGDYNEQEPQWLREIQGVFATDFLRRLYVPGMEHGFLSHKVGGGGRGVKEKYHGSDNDTIKDTIVVSYAADELVSGNTKGNTTDLNQGSIPISVHESPTNDDSALIRLELTSYAKLVTGEPSRKMVNFLTLFTPTRNGVDVVVLVESIRAISERFPNEAYGFFLEKWVARGKYGLWNLDVNLLKEDVGNVLVWIKLHDVPVTAFSKDGLNVIATKLGTYLMLDFYTSNMYMQSWGRSSYTRAMIELQANVELKDTIVVAMPKIVGEGFCSGEAKNLKKPSQTPREKCRKLEKLIIDRKVTLVDDEGKPLNKVDYPGDHDSEDDVESVDNDMARLLASERAGFGTNSLLEQWRDTYENADYDYDPYDDDMY
ncbi:putative reverse transcriptase domain-containing protein [Tanacetum coccineum]